jgi:hypothetical protein
MPTALNDLLKAASRSFYLTLRVLPARVRPQIGLASGARRSRRFNLRQTLRSDFSDDSSLLNIEAA